MGIISINGLRLTAHHGVLPQEQRVGNEFEVNISLDVRGTEVAEQSDNIEDTVNYAEVIDIVKKEMAKPSRLIESVAFRIKEAIMERFGCKEGACEGPCVAAGTLTIAKLAPPVSAQLGSVSYTLTW